MITAIFNPGDKSVTTEKLLQWDYGQVLSIKGLDLPKAVEIHFCVYTDSTTITTVGITTDDHTDVEIPDGLLQQERELRAYVYVADLEQGKTVRTVNIPIQSRQKPEIPHTPEDAELFREAIKAVNDSANRAETAANTSEQNAKKTTEDRVAIAEMVETVSGIEQQVQDVKKYAGQAETAASNAALSEQEAKKSENAALQAKADAETAKGSAETAAGKTAEDRTVVERAEEEVLQAKRQVSTDREAVEAVERKVAQMGNAIPQAVLEGVQAVGNAGAAEKQGIAQAGTEQKSAVESAGTKAVEGITLAKKTATDAVETAKTGAVGAIGTAGAEQTQNVTAEGEKQVKAVADKGAEVLQSIPEDFQTQMQNKLDKNQGVENAGKAMVINPEGVIVPGEVTGGDGIPIINTASGESPLVVSDSAERPIKSLSIMGNTEQLQTTGAQLFDLSKSTIGVAIDKTNGLEVPYGKSWRSSDYIAIRGNTRYSVNVIENNLNTGFAFYREDRTFISGIACQKSFQTPQDAKYVRLTVFNGDNTSKTFMFNEGETAKPYEPYTGGKPSPSPEFPQDIKSVGKWNEEKQKYEVDVRVTGKNIIDDRIESWQQGGYSPTGEYENINYRICLKRLIRIENTEQILLDTGNSNYTFAIRSYDKYKKFARSLTDITANKPITLLPNEEYISVSIQNLTSTQMNLSEFNDMRVFACYFGMNNSYSEYVEQTLTLTSDRPITKWDKLVEKDGEIGWLFSRKIALIPKTGWLYNAIGFFYKGNVFPDANISATPTNETNIFTHFVLGNPQSNKGKDVAWLYVPEIGKGVLRVGVSSETIVTPEEFEKYISDKDMKILYELAEPEFVPLPQPEQNAIRALKTYYPTTVISVDGGEVDPDVEVTYIADTKNYIDQKIAPVIKSVVDTQKALL